MSEFKASGFRDEFGSGGPDLVGITTMTSPYYFVPPSGSTAERPSSPPPGMLRFNTDIGRLEVWRNDHWATILGESPNLGDQNNTNSTGGTGTRAFFGGGLDPATVSDIEFITISTLGNAQDFGDLTGNRQRAGAVASRTRGIIAGGYTGSGFDNQIQKITIASTGDASDTGGNLTRSSNRITGCGNQTRGLFGFGNPSTDTIDYITISSDGDAVDFGNLSYSAEGGASLANSVRGIFMGGETPGSPSTPNNTIEFVTISSTGNAQEFGDLSFNPLQAAACSSSTRGVHGGGLNPSSAVNTIEFLTIATTGNTQDFGDLTDARGDIASASSATRGVWYGGSDPALIAIIDFVEIATTGNAVDFGDPNNTKSSAAGSSNGHGGL